MRLPDWETPANRGSLAGSPLIRARAAASRGYTKGQIPLRVCLRVRLSLEVRENEIDIKYSRCSTLNPSQSHQQLRILRRWGRNQHGCATGCPGLCRLSALCPI